MKKNIIAAIVALLVAVIVISIFIPWKLLILNYVENEFRAVFKTSKVTIGSRDITSRSLIFRNINITTDGQQFMSIKEFRAEYTILSLLKLRTADFSMADTVVYSKLKISEVRGSAKYIVETLTIENLVVKVLGGTIDGYATVKLGKTPRYHVAIKLKDIQLEKVVETFELTEKINIIGAVSGFLELYGEGFMLTKLDGKLSVSPTGGTLTIKNKEWLDTIAFYAKQDVSTISENFRNYHYTEGSASLGLKEAGIIVDAHLSGKSGRRDLIIYLHDFNKKGGNHGS